MVGIFRVVCLILCPPVRCAFRHLAFLLKTTNDLVDALLLNLINLFACSWPFGNNLRNSSLHSQISYVNLNFILTTAIGSKALALLLYFLRGKCSGFWIDLSCFPCLPFFFRRLPRLTISLHLASSFCALFVIVNAAVSAAGFIANRRQPACSLDASHNSFEHASILAVQRENDAHVLAKDFIKIITQALRITHPIVDAFSGLRRDFIHDLTALGDGQRLCTLCELLPVL